MPAGLRNRSIAISGATGFIGSALCKFLSDNDFHIIRIKRKHLKGKVEDLAHVIGNSSVIINLAGAPIASKKWTAAYKKEILNSRVNTTHKLVNAIHTMDEKPDLLISTSAVGIYDSYEVHDEFSTNYAGDFLSDVCQKWEAEAFKVQRIDNVRLCILRLGVVLGKNGGAFPQMLRPFKMGLGAKLGDGHQVFPFIHLKDVLSAMWYLIQRDASSGIYNLVAPEMLSNLEITEALKKRTRKSILPTVPKAILRLVLGDGADALMVGQKVVPKRLQKDGFHFAFPDFNSLLDDIL